MIRSNLCDYGDGYIPVSGTKTISGTGNDDVAKQADERDKLVILKNFVPFIDCLSEINNNQINNSKNIDVVMPIYNLIEYSDNYLKTESLWQYYWDEPSNQIVNPESPKPKIKITVNSSDNGNKKNIEIAFPLKYLRDFCKTLEMPWINCEISLILTWPENCIISIATGATKFVITDTKLYLPVVTLST